MCAFEQTTAVAFLSSAFSILHFHELFMFISIKAFSKQSTSYASDDWKGRELSRITKA